MRRLLAAIPLLLAACATAVPVPGVGVAEPAVQGVPGGVARPDPGLIWPECQNVDLAFSGETTLAALGLNGVGGGADSVKVGQIMVTAGPVAMDVGPLPVGAEPAPAQRMVCVQWADGSGMMGPIPDEWQPPSLLDGGDGAAALADEGPPLGILALVAVAAVLIGVSVLAFRHESS